LFIDELFSITGGSKKIQSNQQDAVTSMFWKKKKKKREKYSVLFSVLNLLIITRHREAVFPFSFSFFLEEFVKPVILLCHCHY